MSVYCKWRKIRHYNLRRNFDVKALCVFWTEIVLQFVGKFVRIWVRCWTHSVITWDGRMAVVAAATCWIVSVKKVHIGPQHVEVVLWVVLQYSLSPSFCTCQHGYLSCFSRFSKSVLCTIYIELVYFKSHVEKALQLSIFCKRCSNNLIWTLALN